VSFAGESILHGLARSASNERPTVFRAVLSCRYLDQVHSCSILRLYGNKGSINASQIDKQNRDTETSPSMTQAMMNSQSVPDLYNPLQVAVINNNFFSAQVRGLGWSVFTAHSLLFSDNAHQGFSSSTYLIIPQAIYYFDPPHECKISFETGRNF
jgi:hypothetical protein